MRLDLVKGTQPGFPHKKNKAHPDLVRFVFAG